MFGQRCLDLCDGCFAGFGAIDLVGLGQHALEGDGRAVEEGENFFIHRLYPVAGVDQHEGAAQGLAASEIGLEQFLPFADDGDRGFGIAVAGKVGHVAVFAQGEVVDFLRAARRVGGAGEGLAARQRVDQAGFADVGAASEADLEPIRRGQAGHGDHAFDEGDGAGEQEAAFFARLIRGVGGEGELQAGHWMDHPSPVVMVPGSVTTA